MVANLAAKADEVKSACPANNTSPSRLWPRKNAHKLNQNPTSCAAMRSIGSPAINRTCAAFRGRRRKKASDFAMIKSLYMFRLSEAAEKIGHFTTTYEN